MFHFLGDVVAVYDCTLKTGGWSWTKGGLAIGDPREGKDHAQLEAQGYALLVTADLNPEDGTEEDAYRTSYTLLRVTSGSKRLVEKWSSLERQKLNGIQGEHL